MAVPEGRILATGTAAEIAALEGPQTRVIDLGCELTLRGGEIVHDVGSVRTAPA